MPALIEPVSDTAIARAATLLRDGRLVAFPTETVYGLGGDATNDRAVAAIFEAKGRPAFNPLICHLPDVEAVRDLVTFDPIAERLAERFWPGALTLVLPRQADCLVSLLASAGLDTMAVRVPAQPAALTLLRAVGRPVAGPSANPSGRISPTTAQHVVDGLGDKVAMILDDGPCPVGIESTVIGVSDGEAYLLRPGGITAEAIEAEIGPLRTPTSNAIQAPGMLQSHYAPGRPVRLNARDARPGEALLGFGPDAPPGPNLSPSGDLIEAAANLFALLHELDRPENESIAVMPVPDTGLGRAINDRLRRAAAC